jgi:hypothetical protein
MGMAKEKTKARDTMKSTAFARKEFTVASSDKKILLDMIFREFTEEEQRELFMLSMSGYWDMRNNTVLMGTWAMNRYNEYIDSLIYKYLG